MEYKAGKIEKAVLSDLDAIEAIYNAIHTEEEAGRTSIGWVRDIYPTRKTAEDSIARDDMFVYKDRDKVLAAGIINKLQLDAYSLCHWTIPAKDDEVMVLHTLVVSPEHKGGGIGSYFVDFYEKYAFEQDCRVLRIDTQARNRAARALYKKLGFHEAEIVNCEFFNGINSIELVCIEKKVPQLG